MMQRSAERAAKAGEAVGGFQIKSTEAGAATQVWAATSPDLVGHNGAYLADCSVGVAGANPSNNGFEPYIADEATADRLWELSEQLLDS